MSSPCFSPDCNTVQIIEPKGDLIVDTAGTTSDMDERGDLTLVQGQTSASVTFQVPKLNANYHFEYLYVDAQGNVHPGAVIIVPTIWTMQGFTVVFAGAPIGTGYVLHWRVVIVVTSILGQVDAPEDLYLQMPQTNLMAITFINPRSTLTYGFAELRVENLIDPPAGQAVISVQPYLKTLTGFGLAVNPTPPSANYFLRVRTP
jgi:hypothetical protein